jgi:two-component system, chemotaxis family, chemotaxis protein CheY
MNSTNDDLLHLILHSDLSIDERAQLRCRLAKNLEEVGKYEAARDAMGELWTGVGSTPKLEGLTQRSNGEVLLRAGSLTGWLGSIKQIQGAQEQAKNLISQSIAIFQLLGDVKKLAEAQTEIGLCYKREGALDNARVWFDEALSRLDDEDGDLKAVALLRKAVLEQLAHRLTDAFNILTTAAPLLDISTNHTLQGRFHNEFAMVLEELGAIEHRNDYLDRALIEYSAASFHFDQARHARYQACVENNLAMLYLKLHRFEESHEHLDRAQALFTRLNDNVHLAQVEETRARVMLAEGDLIRAVKSAHSAVVRLDKGQEPTLQAEALTTYGFALSRINDPQHAREALERAIAVAEQAGDLESSGLAALTLFEQLAEQLSIDEICQVLERAYDVLKDTRNPVTRERLTTSAFRALSMIHTFRPDWDSFSLVQTLNRYKAHYIQLALEDTGGNVSQASRRLGLSRHSNLQYMLKKFQIDLPTGRTTMSEDEPTPIAISTPSAEPGSHRPQTVRILHVEDDATIAALVRDIADQEGWEIDLCVEEHDALKQLGGVVHYDLLLIEHHLPGMNGIKLVERARSMVHRRYVPIVIISGTLDERSAREAGADSFLHKPQDFELLVQTISRLLDPDQEV